MLFQLFSSGLEEFLETPSVKFELMGSKYSVLRFDGLKRETQLDDAMLNALSDELAHNSHISRLCLEYQNNFSQEGWQKFFKAMGKSSWAIEDFSLQGCFFSDAVKENLFQMLLKYKKPLWLVVNEDVKNFLLEKAKNCSCETYALLKRHEFMTLCERDLAYRQLEIGEPLIYSESGFHIESLCLFHNSKEARQLIHGGKTSKIIVREILEHNHDHELLSLMKYLKDSKLHSLDLRGVSFSEKGLKTLIDSLWLYRHRCLWIVLDQGYEKPAEEIVAKLVRSMKDGVSFMRHMVFYNGPIESKEGKSFYVKGAVHVLPEVQKDDRKQKDDECCCSLFGF